MFLMLLLKHSHRTYATNANLHGMAPKARARSKSVPKVPKAKAAVLVPAQFGTSIARRTASNQTSSSHDVASEEPIVHGQAPLPPTLTPEPAAAAKLECSAPDPAALLVGKIERLLRDCLSAARPDLRILEIAVLDARHFPGISPELLAQAEDNGRPSCSPSDALLALPCPPAPRPSPSAILLACMLAPNVDADLQNSPATTAHNFISRVASPSVLLLAQRHDNDNISVTSLIQQRQQRR